MEHKLWQNTSVTIGGGVQLIAFADDLAFLIEGKNEGGGDKVLVIMGPKTIAIPSVNIRSIEIQRTKLVKYMGPTLQKYSIFPKHIDYMARRASEKIAALSRITPNIRGPVYLKKSGLCGVTHTIRVYAAPV
ncbi:hypothetical protein HHI36_017353 [Cryptolaemus montrouzieri]|uniref:Reverse transcriptase domain-containing protein n=1 Tax=Cryptolaemus montrouzieri TaxID=559131 RepID=A0ABD2NMB5_9CUCU